MYNIRVGNVPVDFVELSTQQLLSCCEDCAPPEVEGVRCAEGGWAEEVRLTCWWIDRWRDILNSYEVHSAQHRVCDLSSVSC